jgi:hypothetical protein
LGLDTNHPSIKIGNFLLKKNILSLITKSYTISVVDEKYDLLNKPIEENEELIDFIKDSYNDNYSFISVKSLEQYHFNTRLKKVDFSNYFSDTNFILKKHENSYGIIIADKEKDIDGRTLSGEITVSQVIGAIMDYKISEHDLADTKETTINKDLVDHLKEYFVPVKKSTGNTTKYYDVVVGDDDVIIEIKLARELLKSNNYQRTLGQIQDYTKNLGTKDNLILLVIGEKHEKLERNIHLLESTIKNEKMCHYFYKTAH